MTDEEFRLICTLGKLLSVPADSRPSRVLESAIYFIEKAKERDENLIRGLRNLLTEINK